MHDFTAKVPPNQVILCRLTRLSRLLYGKSTPEGVGGMLTLNPPEENELQAKIAPERTRIYDLKLPQ